MVKGKRQHSMKSSTTRTFRKDLAGLDLRVRKLAVKQYRLWLEDHWHPSLHFKRVGDYWSVRIDRDYRALGVEKDGTVIWFFIGRHESYERKI